MVITKKSKKIIGIVLAIALLFTSLYLGAIVPVSAATIPEEDATVSGASASDFSWDNASVYFLLTDRFYNGNSSNDNSYNRGKDKNGNKINFSDSDKVGVFQGGDFAGITQKINEGYFTDLGINAIWVSAPYEQIHGYCVGVDGRRSFPHYSYHGYYGSDWSQPDANFGTEAEFQTMVDTAHSKGIRIVLDIVMNHTGYNTMYDMNEYGFGTLKSGWQDVYYNFDSIQMGPYHNSIDYNGDSNAWGNWWGTNWVRAGLAGYKEDGGGDLTGTLASLPDFRTESTNTVSVPQFLQTKWQREGTYSTKMSEMDSWFNSTGNSKRVRNYLVYWLSSWVRKYGVDGFRCDTAKHVEMDSWKALKTECVKALKDWKAANPSKKLDDLDFWMTGENWGQGLGKNSYFDNGFDSMINFSFNGSADRNSGGMPSVNEINGVYQNYASNINTQSGYNVLSYISSHDTSLARRTSIGQENSAALYWEGSALLMLPGGVQIFYGDETSRKLVDCLIADHTVRDFMNWNEFANSSSNQAKLLAHWQKVGQFRNNHIAVGAGTHANLNASSGAAFVRKYNKNGIDDTIAAVIGANANQSITLNLNGAFADGTVVKNTYDGSTATVSGGSVTFNSGSTGTILIEKLTDVQPTTPEPTTIATTPEPTTIATTPEPTTIATTPEPTTIATTPEPTTIVTTSSQTTVPVVTTVPGETKPISNFPGIQDNKDGTFTVKLGDVNLDNNINISDVTAILKHLVKIISLSTEYHPYAMISGNSDDSNSIINIKDATSILKWIVKLPDTENIGINKIIVDDTPTTVAETTTETPSTTVLPLETTLPLPTTEEPTDEIITTNEIVITTETVTATEIVTTTEIPTTTEAITTVTPTEPTTILPTEPVGDVIYFDNSNSNWGSVVVHYWGGGFGGDYEPSSVNGNIYTFTFPNGLSGIEGIKFHVAIDNWSQQAIGDIKGSDLQAGATYTADSVTPKFGGGGNNNNDAMTIYFVDNHNWGNAVMHYWNLDGGSGDLEASGVDGNRYTFNLPNGISEINGTSEISGVKFHVAAGDWTKEAADEINASSLINGATYNADGSSAVSAFSFVTIFDFASSLFGLK